MSVKNVFIILIGLMTFSSFGLAKEVSLPKNLQQEIIQTIAQCISRPDGDFGIYSNCGKILVIESESANIDRETGEDIDGSPAQLSGYIQLKNDKVPFRIFWVSNQGGAAESVSFFDNNNSLIGHYDEQNINSTQPLSVLWAFVLNSF